MMWHSFLWCNIRCDRKFNQINFWKFLASKFHRLLHFLTNHVLTKSRNEMLDTTAYYDSIRIFRNKFYGIANGVSPQPCIAVNYNSVIFSKLNFTDREASWFFIEIFFSRNKLKENSRIQKQKQAFCLLRILICKKSFRCRIGFYRVNFLSDRFEKLGAI